MSDTPRTDAALESTWGSINVPTNPIPADFARQLERELAEVTKQRNHLDMLIVNFCKDHKWAAAMWKQQNHVKPLFDYAKKAKGGDA